MENLKKACVASLIMLSLLLQPAVAAAHADAAGIDTIIDDVSALILDTVTSPGIGQVGGDWALFALMRSGAPVSDAYRTAYYEKAAEQIAADSGILSAVKNSEYSRVVIAMSAIGADPRDVGGYDLLAPLLDFDATVVQGINGPIFALIAFSAAGYDDEPVAERYIEYILSKQFEDGGFALSGSISDPDTTAMVITALSQYTEHEGVSVAIERALSRLSRLQRTTGGFTSFSSTNSESVAQAIIALCSIGVPIDDERFVKDGNTLLDNLLTYYNEGSGFEHELGGGESLMSAEQALCALAALRRLYTGQNALYDLGDAPAFSPDAPKDGLDGKHPDVKVPGAALPGAGFSDVAGHKGETAILALAERGVVTGYPNGSFAPDGTVTRAEFAAIIVRALGLRPGDPNIAFTDVPAGSWFHDFARAAYKYGIINGRSAGVFDPHGLITRQEAALMIARAAALCGLSLTLDDNAIRNILAPFSDYRTAAPWAAEALAFCCYFGMIDDSGIELKPLEHIARGEAAEMVYLMLARARLV